MLTRLLRRFRGTPPRRRLDAEQALARAREAAQAAGHEAEALHLVIPMERGGQLLWQVTDAVRGSCLLVEIDDASATVVSITRHGGR